MKTTVVPAHTLLAEAETVTLTGGNGVTVIMRVFKIAGLLVTQGVREEERTQVTTSPLEGVYMNVGLFTPWLVPLIFRS